MHGLQDRTDSPHAAVDVGVGQKICRQVAVQPRLHGGRRVDPQCWVEEDVVQQLPGEKGLAKGLD